MMSNGSLDDTKNSQEIDRSSSQSIDVTRRRFLSTSAVGIAGLGALGSAAAAKNKHTLLIEGTGPVSSYSFTVGGNLEKSTAHGASTDSNDEIIGRSAHGTVGGYKDAYTFTGPLYSFDFDRSNPINVTLDGEAAHVGQRPDRTLLIEGFGPDTSYSFATDGVIEKSEAYGASKNPLDKVNGYGAVGAVQSGKDAYTYNGDLQAFEFDQDGTVRVTIDGKAAHVGQRPDQAMILFSEGGKSAGYEVRINGSVREVLHDDQGGQGPRVTRDTVTGSVSGDSYDKFTYDGEIGSVDSDNPYALEVYTNYRKYL